MSYVVAQSIIIYRCASFLNFLFGCLRLCRAQRGDNMPSDVIRIRPRPQIDFSNEADGVDWSAMLPPHLLQASAAPPVVQQAERTMVFDWPLPENHPALQPQRASRPMRRALQPTPVAPQQGGGTDRHTSRRSMAAAREQQLFDHWSGTTAGSASRVSRRVVSPAPHAADAARRTAEVPSTASHEAPRQGIVQGSTAALPQHGGGGSGWELNDFSYESLLELGSMAVSTGLDKKQLQRIKPVTLTPNLLRGSDDRTVDCSVCLEHVSLGDQCILLGCGHVYHPGCILPWLAKSNKCPSCRFEVARKDFKC